MANYFEITRPDGLGVAKLDSSGRAEVQYTVKNVSGIKRDGRAVLVSLPSAPGAAEKNWVKVDGATQRAFDPNQTQTFVVKIAVPPKSPEGSYAFRLDTVLVERPDEGDQGQPVAINIGPKPVPPKIKWWIPVAVVAAIAIIGLLIWLLVPKGVPVPDLKGQLPSDAKNTLVTAGFVLDPNFDPNTDLVDSTPDLVGKVAAQTPTAGNKGKKGSTVKVQLGSVEVTVPDVQTQPLDQATKMLNTAGLQVGTVTTRQVPNTTGGFVLSQSVPAGTKAKSNTAVDLAVAQLMVPVPQVTNLPVAQAVLALQNAKLVFAGVSGNQPNSNVTGSTPAPGTLVNAGTAVTLSVPSTCDVGVLCITPGWQYHSLVSGGGGQFTAAPVRTQHW
jgi:beta-lactam-binding protein with PASTA domain